MNRNRNHSNESDHDDPVQPACRATTERIQRVLDGTENDSGLECDAHASTCSDCRERIRAMRLLLVVLLKPAPVTVPSELTQSVLASVQLQRRDHVRNRALAITAAFGIAASLMLVFWLNMRPDALSPLPRHGDVAFPSTPSAISPIRFGDELAKAGTAIRESTRPITEPAVATPSAFASLTQRLIRPPTPLATARLEPVRKSLAEIPETARIGLEPVTGSAEKAINRFLHDVVAIKPNS